MAVTLRYGQDQEVTITVTGIFTKYGKVLGDVSKAIVTLKSDEKLSDSQASYAKNSVDDSSQVSIAYDSGTGVYTITATVLTADFGAANNKVRANVDYYVGGGVVFDDDANTTFELDEYTTDDVVRFIGQRVDTIAS